MEMKVTVGMQITHVLADRIPVLDSRKQIVGHVVSVRPIDDLNDQISSEITVEISDDAARQALMDYIETQRPVFHVLFPRTPSNLKGSFKA